MSNNQTWTHLDSPLKTTLESKTSQPISLKTSLYSSRRRRDTKGGLVLNWGYVREGEALVSFVSIVRDPCVVKPWDEQKTPEDDEENSWFHTIKQRENQ